MEYIRKNIKFLFVFILPVYFFIVQTSIQNKHTHFFLNGIVVTHSHPVDNEKEQPINKHDHTQIEIVLFQQLNFDYYTIAPELDFCKNDLVIINKYFIAEDKKHLISFAQDPFKRGPPVFSHSA